MVASAGNDANEASERTPQNTKKPRWAGATFPFGCYLQQRSVQPGTEGYSVAAAP